MSDMPQLTIGEVAQRAGLATSSIRYYESIGLLPEPIRLHGQRRYDADVLGSLAFIGAAQSAGFRLEEIKELLGGAAAEGGMAPRLRRMSSRKLGEVDAMLARAQWMKGWLETRSRVIFALLWTASYVLFMAVPGREAGKSSDKLAIVLSMLALAFVFVPVWLAGSGIRTQPPFGFSSTKGLHGSTLFTLSLPVSRARLLLVRSALGLLEMVQRTKRQGGRLVFVNEHGQSADVVF